MSKVKRKISEISPEALTTAKKSQSVFTVKYSGASSCKVVSPEVEQKNSYMQKQTASDTTSKMSNNDDLKMFIANLMDEKMGKLATKDDISAIGMQLNNLKVANAELNHKLEEVETRCVLLEKRIEMLSTIAKERNIIFTIPTSQLMESDVQSKIKNLCSTLVDHELQLPSVKKIFEGHGTSKYLLQLNTRDDVSDLLKNSKKLRNTGVFISKDYTKAAQIRRSVLFKYRKCIKFFDKNSKPLIKGFKLEVKDKVFVVNDANLLVCGEKNGETVLQELFPGIQFESTVNQNKKAQTSTGTMDLKQATGNQLTSRIRQSTQTENAPACSKTLQSSA